MLRKKNHDFLYSLLILMTLIFVHCGGSSSDDNPSGETGGGAPDSSFNEDEDPAWYGDNAARLAQFIDEKGNDGDDYQSYNPPYAVFDWDNTVIKNDVGDATMFWMINHNLIKQPATKDWSSTSELLTVEALQALKAACDAQADSKQPLTTDQSTTASRACADEIVSIYGSGVTTGDDEAFDDTRYDSHLIEPAYAWAVQLQSGYTPDEIRKIANDAIEFNLANEIDATQKVGNTDVAAYLRIYEPIHDLMNALQGNGFDVWIASASGQYIVETFAKKVGVEADHVIGVRSMLNKSGRITPYFAGCGTEPNGNQSMITYKDGKRCWINQEIFKIAKSEDMMIVPSPIHFAAGDSDTDITFVKDATDLKLAINRNKKELMCNAYSDLYSKADNPDGKWLVNPMFINPKGQLTNADGSHTYSCASYSLTDQLDSIFAD